MNSLPRRWLFLLVVAGVGLALDQFTKNAVINNLMVGESQRLIPFLYPFFQVTRSENLGAAFGFLPQAGDIFLIIALVVVVIMIIFYPRVPEKARLTRFALGLIVGGALGNAFDRINHGAVIDFIHYTIPGIVSNVSNLADHAIVIGVLVIVLQSWRTEPENQEATDAESGGIPQ